MSLSKKFNICDSPGLATQAEALIGRLAVPLLVQSPDIWLQSPLVAGPALQDQARVLTAMLEAPVDRARILAHADQPLRPSGQTPVSLFAMLKSPLLYFRQQRRRSKVLRALIWVIKWLLIVATIWLVAIGRPQYIAQGLIQGIKFGFDTECSDWWTCNEPQGR